MHVTKLTKSTGPQVTPLQSPAGILSMAHVVNQACTAFPSQRLETIVPQNCPQTCNSRRWSTLDLFWIYSIPKDPSTLLQGIDPKPWYTDQTRTIHLWAGGSAGWESKQSRSRNDEFFRSGSGKAPLPNFRYLGTIDRETLPCNKVITYRL